MFVAMVILQYFVFCILLRMDFLSGAILVYYLTMGRLGARGSRKN